MGAYSLIRVGYKSICHYTLVLSSALGVAHGLVTIPLCLVSHHVVDRSQCKPRPFTDVIICFGVAALGYRTTRSLYSMATTNRDELERLLARVDQQSTLISMLKERADKIQDEVCCRINYIGLKSSLDTHS